MNSWCPGHCPFPAHPHDQPAGVALRLPVSGGGAGRVAESGVFSLEAEGREVEFIGPDTTLLLGNLITIIRITPRLVNETLRRINTTNVPKPSNTSPNNIPDDVTGSGPRKLLTPRETILIRSKPQLPEPSLLRISEGDPLIPDIQQGQLSSHRDVVTKRIDPTKLHKRRPRLPSLIRHTNNQNRVRRKHHNRRKQPLLKIIPRHVHKTPSHIGPHQNTKQSSPQDPPPISLRPHPPSFPCETRPF